MGDPDARPAGARRTFDQRGPDSSASSTATWTARRPHRHRLLRAAEQRRSSSTAPSMSSTAITRPANSRSAKPSRCEPESAVRHDHVRPAVVDFFPLVQLTQASLTIGDPADMRIRTSMDIIGPGSTLLSLGGAGLIHPLFPLKDRSDFHGRRQRAARSIDVKITGMELLNAMSSSPAAPSSAARTSRSTTCRYQQWNVDLRSVAQRLVTGGLHGGGIYQNGASLNINNSLSDRQLARRPRCRWRRHLRRQRRRVTFFYTTIAGNSTTRASSRRRRRGPQELHARCVRGHDLRQLHDRRRCPTAAACSSTTATPCSKSPSSAATSPSGSNSEAAAGHRRRGEPSFDSRRTTTLSFNHTLATGARRRRLRGRRNARHQQLWRHPELHHGTRTPRRRHRGQRRRHVADRTPRAVDAGIAPPAQQPRRRRRESWAATLTIRDSTRVRQPGPALRVQGRRRLSATPISPARRPPPSSTRRSPETRPRLRGGGVFNADGRTEISTARSPTTPRRSSTPAPASPARATPRRSRSSSRRSSPATSAPRRARAATSTSSTAPFANSFAVAGLQRHRHRATRIGVVQPARRQDRHHRIRCWARWPTTAA